MSDKVLVERQAITDDMVRAARSVIVGFGGEWGEHNEYLSEEAAREVLEAALSVAPQAIAAQSAPDAHERWLSDPNNEPFPGGLSGIPMPALQSAPDEREGSGK